MPRNPRGHTPDAVFHIINRGVERRTIFSKREDYHFFLTQMRQSFKQGGVSLLSYCLMPNHFHFLAGTAKTPVGESMQALQTRYALFFNRIYERVGHLFQSRFQSFEVRDQAYLARLPAYINLNPVRASLVPEPSRWEWSSHNELTSGANRFLDLSRLSELAGMRSDEFRSAYVEGIGKYGKPPTAAATMQQLAEWAALLCGIREQDLVEGVRGGPFTRAKKILVKAALGRGFMLTDVAKHLNCTLAALRIPDEFK